MLSTEIRLNGSIVANLYTTDMGSRCSYIYSEPGSPRTCVTGGVPHEKSRGMAHLLGMIFSDIQGQLEHFKVMKGEMV